jgi:hypothetical protein
MWGRCGALVLGNFFYSVSVVKSCVESCFLKNGLASVDALRVRFHRMYSSVLGERRVAFFIKFLKIKLVPEPPQHRGVASSLGLSCRALG